MEVSDQPDAPAALPLVPNV